MVDPANSNAPDAPVLDETRLADLEAAIGPAQMFILLDMLAAEARNQPGVIARLVELGQLHIAATEAHALKGAALGLCALRLGAAARAIEGIETAGDPGALLAELRDAALATLIALDERSGRRSAA